MKLLRDILVLLNLVLGCFVLGVVAYVLWQVGPSVQPLVRDTHTAVIEAALTLKNLREASATWKKASEEQARETTLAMSNVTAAAEKFSGLISRTDNSLNSRLLPALTKLAEDQNAALLKSQAALQVNLAEMSQATQQAQKVLDDADAQIASPQVKLTLDNVAASSENLAKATADASATIASVRQGVEYEVHEITKPVSAVKKVVLFAATLAGKFLGF